MSYDIIPTDNFKREVKHLAKKYPSLKNDLHQLRIDLQINPKLGTHLGHNVYKIRVAISTKGRGKSGGARVISYIYSLNEQIFLISIYDKSEKENISSADIKSFIDNFFH